MNGDYYLNILVSYVRGRALKTGVPSLSPHLLNTPIESLSQEDIDVVFNLGKEASLKLYKFKRNHDCLPRVKRVMGFLRGVEHSSVLDVGSGRGVFLFPYISEFPCVRVTSLDILDNRIEVLEDISRGGITNLNAVKGDICSSGFKDKSFDVVTLLEVLEHIENVDMAINEAVRLARKFIVVTVPSKEDNNPEHIHLLTKEKLTLLFNQAGVTNLSFDGVNGHLVLIATIK